MNQKEIIRAHGLYLCGMSLQKVAPRFNVTRQNLWRYFKELKLSTRPKKLNPSVVFNGKTYFKSSKGYWRTSKEPRTLLHKDMFESVNGPVPANCRLIFVDGNCDNHALENILCLTRSEHQYILQHFPSISSAK